MNSKTDPIKVLIVDDSAIVRKILSDELSKDPEINVVGTAIDPYVAREKILKLQPDLVLLDIEMPRMDGLTFLAKIMKYHPLPVIIISSLTRRGSKHALKALELGAVDIMAKPGGPYSVGEMKHHLIEIVKSIPLVRMKSSGNGNTSHPIQPLSRTSQKRLIAIGASTGGTVAIKEILQRLPVNIPGIVIVQHMPVSFTGAFADRLDQECDLEVKEAENGDRITDGKVLIAPGDKHLLVKKGQNGYHVETRDGPLVNYHKPSVDVLFKSVAKASDREALGVILTGMGRDGAEGLSQMRETGAYNIAQDEASAMIFGMPKEAIKLEAAQSIVPLNEIADEIVHIVTS